MKVRLLWTHLWEWGGVGIACKRTNRGFIGVEIDEKYFNIAKRRIEENIDYIPEKAAVGQMSIFDFMEED